MRRPGRLYLGNCRESNLLSICTEKLSAQVSRARKNAASCSRLAALLLSVTGACCFCFLGIVAADSVAGAAHAGVAGLVGAAGLAGAAG